MEKIKCPICFDFYSNGKIPKILPCGHTICIQCISNIKKQCEEDDDSYTDNSKDSFFYKNHNDKEEEKKIDIIDTSLLSNLSRSKKKKERKMSLPSYSLEIENEEEKKIDDNNNNNKDNNNSENLNESNEYFSDEDDYDNLNEDDEEDSETSEEEEEESSSSSSNNQDDQDDNSETLNMQNLILDNSIEKNDKKKEKKFKFRCPFCLKRIKLYEAQIIINKNILLFNNYLNSDEKNINIINEEKVNDNDEDKKNILDDKKEEINDYENKNIIFCKKCRIIDNIETHFKKYEEFHKEFYIYLTQDNFIYNINYFKKYKNYESMYKNNLVTFLNNFNKNLYDNINIINDIKKFMLLKISKNSVNNHFKEKCNYKFQEAKKKLNNSNNSIENHLNIISQLTFLLSDYKMYFEFLRTKLEDTISNKEYILNIIKYIYHKLFITILEEGYFHSISNDLFDIESQHIYFYNKKLNNHYICNASINSMTRIYHGLKYITTSNEINSDGTIIYYFGENKKKSNNFISYNLITKTKTNLKNVPNKFYSFDTLYQNDIIYIIGGESKKNVGSNKCFEYLIEKDSWNKLPNLNYSKYKKCLTLVNNTLFSFGGKSNTGDNIYVFEKLDLNKKDSWNMFKIENYYGNIYNFGYCLYSKSTLIIIGGEDQIIEDYDLKGYIINIEKNKLDYEFKIKNVFFNNNQTPKFYRGIIYGRDDEFYDVDKFKFWKQIDKIPLTIN